MCNKIDRLGRIVIPIKLRKKYNLNEGVQIEFIETNGRIALSATPCLCRICQKEIRADGDFPLCENCLNDIKNRQR